MDKHGFLPSKPIQVCRDGNKLVVIDGHHRLEAARELGIAVYYVLESADHLDLIGEMNVTVRTWSNLSFVKLHAESGNQHFITLLEYADKGIAVKCAASLLRGESAHSGNAGRLLRSGEFQVKTTKIIDWIVGVMEQTKEVAPEIIKQSYVEALAMCWFVEEFDHKAIAGKILGMPRGIVRAADRKQALMSLEEVYNFKRSIKINLVFLVQEIMRKRSAA